MPNDDDDYKPGVRPDEKIIHFERKPKGNGSGTHANENGTPPPSLPLLPLDVWGDNEPPTREWAVDQIMPRSNVTLLSGEGAIGKTILMMQLCVAHAAGRDWIQQLPMPGPALYLGAEDDADELWRRFALIVKHYRITFPELVDRLFVSSLAGEDAVLAVADRSGLVRPTMLYQQLLDLVQRVRPIMIALDTAADLFAGNENDRGQVRQFIGLLRKLAIAGRSSVLLASHPSLQGMQNDSGLSGSTAWHNSVRSRLYLKSATNGDGSSDNGLRILEMRKSNYGPNARSIAIRWDAGVFKPVDNLKSEVERAESEADDERIFLLLLERYRERDRNVTEKPGRGFAPAEFAKESEGEKLGQKRLDAAMRRLFDKKKIAMVQYGKPSNPHHRIASTELGL